MLKMRIGFLFTILLFSFSLTYAQGIVYIDEFDKGILSVGGNPTGYTMNLSNENFQIVGNGSAGPWTAMTYSAHDGSGNPILVNASEKPILYIKAKGENQPSLRIDFQDQTGYVTNQQPIEVNLDNNYKIYALDFTDRLLDGAYGGPCDNAPCIVDASKIQGLILFVNAPTGGYNGTIDIEWISIGDSLEDINASENHEIRYNQVAYLVGRQKVLNIVSNNIIENLNYTLTNKSNGDLIMEGKVNINSKWQPSNEFVATVDFTDLNEIGEYIFETNSQSVTIKIESDGYEELSKASLKYYYFNRASQELKEEYAGEWNRPLGHPDNEVLIHSSAASPDRPVGSIISSPKGWYDAGDYNKYIVNSGISTYTLLTAYEHYSDYYKNHTVTIPEQGDDMPDILDEVLWNIEWMLSMQDPGDGGVYHKLTGLNFSGIVMPHQYNMNRYVVQKTTSAALNFAAVMATASRIFSEYDEVIPNFSNQLITAAKEAFEWAKENPTVYYSQPSDVKTGEYGDGNVSDEFQWAATELFISTGEEKYKNEINENVIGNGIASWGYTAPLALVSIVHHSQALGDDLNVELIQNKLLSTANSLLATIDQSSMRVAMGNSNNDFVWGSNGQAGNQIIILLRAYELTKDQNYLNAAFLAMDYLLGRNGTGFCYVSGFGDKSPKRPHHRQSEADNVINPVPGMVVGGPNPGKQDGCAGYIGNSPASAYVDSWCSYASNEVTINWNAPFAYSINALRYYQNGISNTDNNKSYELKAKLEVFPNPGFDILTIPKVNEGTMDKITILDAQGVIIKEIFRPVTDSINVVDLPAGIYIIKAEEKGSEHVTQWIKKQ